MFCRFHRKLYQRANFVTLYFLTSKRLVVICARCASCALDCQCAYMRKICARFSPNAQDLRKIVLISPMRNICTRLVQDCTSFPNAQNLHKIVLLSPMHNICTRLYLFPQCARFAQGCTYFSNAQYICARFAQDCTSFANAQYMHKIVLISPMHNICARFAQDCT